MFQACPAERRASPGERGPQIAPLLRELGQEAGIIRTSLTQDKKEAVFFKPRHYQKSGMFF